MRLRVKRTYSTYTYVGQEVFSYQIHELTTLHRFQHTLRNDFPSRFFSASFFNGRPAEAPRADLDGDGFDRSMPHAPG